MIYKLFHSRTASKAVAAKYLSELLKGHGTANKIDAVGFRKILPAYLVAAIDYVTSKQKQTISVSAAAGGKGNA